MRLNELHLTKFRLRFPFSGSTRVVRKAWDTANINELWKQTMWSRKVEAKKKVLKKFLIIMLIIDSRYLNIKILK